MKLYELKKQLVNNYTDYINCLYMCVYKFSISVVVELNIVVKNILQINC